MRMQAAGFAKAVRAHKGVGDVAVCARSFPPN
jgi:hypothetical protein